MDGKLRNMASVYILHENKILLLYRQGGRVVNDVWVGSAGGHFEEFELNDAKSCALRELEEETGLAENALKYIRLRYITLRRTKGEIRQNYYFFAELRERENYDFVSREGELRWFDISEIRNLEMPFSAKFMMEHYLDVGVHNDKIYGGISDGRNVIFTEMPEF